MSSSSSCRSPTWGAPRSASACSRARRGPPGSRPRSTMRTSPRGAHGRRSLSESVERLRARHPRRRVVLRRRCVRRRDPAGRRLRRRRSSSTTRRPTIVDGADGCARVARGRSSIALRERIAALSPRSSASRRRSTRPAASLAVARRLKALPNPPIVVFGGANCEGEMGLQLLRSFDWIDYVCCGEADRRLPGAPRASAARRADAVDRACCARAHSTSVAVSESIQDLNTLPYPGLRRLLRGARRGGDRPRRRVPRDRRDVARLLVGREAPLHVLRPQRRDDGVPQQDARAGVRRDDARSAAPTASARIGCVDNILDMRYIDTLFPRLAESGLRARALLRSEGQPAPRPARAHAPRRHPPDPARASKASATRCSA